MFFKLLNKFKWKSTKLFKKFNIKKYIFYGVLTKVHEQERDGFTQIEQKTEIVHKRI